MAEKKVEKSAKDKEDLAALQEALDAVRASKPVPVPEELSGLGAEELASTVTEGLSEEAVPVAVGSPDDPFMAGSFRTCHNEGCDLRAGCLRFRLRKQRLIELQGFYYPDEKCHVGLNDPKWWGKFALDPIEDRAL